ncbi:MAG: lysophospholipid acyltransferase family protein [Polyangiales bacterium]
MRDEESIPPKPSRAAAVMGRLAEARRTLLSGFDRGVDRVLGEDLLNRLGSVSVGDSESGVDPFGFDPQVARYAMVVARALYRDWFRAEVHGMENVPDGRVLLVSNHSGQIPLDGLAIGCALLLERNPPRYVRSMVEKWSATLPFVSTFFTRLGQIVGVPENCQRLLEREEAILVFPEGSKGISKPFSQRYKLSDFGLGFMRLALATGTPIVPVAVVGAEEQYISVANLTRLAKLTGAPAFPVIPQLLLPGGFLPMPVKYHIWFGEPIRATGDPDDDDAVIEEKVWQVRATVQSMVNRGLKDRRGIFR